MMIVARAVAVVVVLVTAGAAHCEDVYGKKLFEEICSRCHPSPVGLGKAKQDKYPTGLAGYLSEHYMSRRQGDQDPGHVAAYLLANPGHTNLAQETPAHDVSIGPVGYGADGQLVPRIGVNIGAIDDNSRARYNIPPNISQGALIIGVAPNTDAAAKGLTPGDVIIQVGDAKVLTPNSISITLDFLLSQGHTSVALLVVRGSYSQQHWVSVSFLKKYQADASTEYFRSPLAQAAAPQEPADSPGTGVTKSLDEGIPQTVVDSTPNAGPVIGVIVSVLALAMIWGIAHVISRGTKEGALKTLPQDGLMIKATLSTQEDGRYPMSVTTNKQEQPYYGQAKQDFTAALRDSPRNPDEPQSLVARAIIFIARVFAGTVMLVLWIVIIGPVWFAMLLRTIAAFSIATVFALFTSATPPNVARLDAIAELWVRGFTKIVSNFTQRDYSAPAMYIPLKPLEALQETGLAILLYAGLFASLWTIAHLSVSLPVYIFHLFWPQ